MSPDLPLARADERVGDVVARLIANNMPGAAVIDADERYTGMFAIHDLLTLIVPRVALAGNVTANLRFIDSAGGELRQRFADLTSKSIGELADRGAATLRAGAPATEAVRLLCQSQGPFAVVDESTGKVSGIITSRDLVRVLAS